MGMVIRTRATKVALCFKLICIFTVFFVFYIKSVFINDNKNELLIDNVEPVVQTTNVLHGRHLLATINNGEEFIRNLTVQNITNSKNEHKKNCSSSINEFPADGFTHDQRKNGWIILHILLAGYLFIFLAVVCDDYFVPCIKKICNRLNLKEDVAGATFMAIASSSAEIFINSIGTFITEGDLGVGTIVGSAVFNILAVPACCGLFANMVLELEFFALTRDSLIYGCAVVLLIIFLQDGKIYFYEALTLVLLYSFYVLIMMFNDSISSYFNKMAAKFKKKGYYTEIANEHHPLLFNLNDKNGKYATGIEGISVSDSSLKDFDELEESTDIWRYPVSQNKKQQFWWILTWPISFVLYFTIPNRIHSNIYPLTFVMCVVWIGMTSYMEAWLITIIGDTLGVPDSVMGLTFLAAGTSVPEAVSSVLVTNQGFGSMGISSSIGSNTFDILICLGIPWFIKSGFYPTVPEQHWITINSQGMNYSASCLLITLILLYVTFCLNKFKLDWKVGLVCLIMYVGFLTFATLIELNLFFQVNVPACS